MRRVVARVVTVVCVGLIAIGLPAAFAGPVSAAVAGPSFTSYRGGILTDPSTGRVFVPADDAVFVFDAGGASIKSIDNVYGAGSADLADGFLWVTETTAGAVAKIDPVTLTVVKTFPVSRPIGSAIAVVGGGAFLSVSDKQSSYRIGRLDLATGAVLLTETGAPEPGTFRHIPNDPTAFLAAPRYSSGVQKISGVAPYAWISGTQDGTYATSLVVNADGSRFYRAGQEYATATLALTGANYTGMTGGYSPAASGLLAGGGDQLTITRIGSTRSHVFPIDGPTSPPGTPQVYEDGIAIASDGSHVYAVEADGYATSLRLVTKALAASASAISPSGVTAGVPTIVTVTGNGLGTTAGATVGGVAATFTVLSPTSVQVTMPTSVGAGSQPVVLSGPFGPASIGLTVSANPGASLVGTVRAGFQARPGIVLALSGSGLATAKQTTTSATGGYSFAGIPYGTDYTLALHDPTNAVPDYSTGPLTLTPPGSSTVDLDVTHPSPPPGAERARAVLPGARVADVQIDGATGRVFVAHRDDIDVYTPAGVLVKRIHGQWGVSAMVVVGGSLYANLPGRAVVNRIDTTSLTVVATFTVGATLAPGLGFSGGRLWIASGVAGTSALVLAALDPTTGAKTLTDAYASGASAIRGVRGSTDRLLVSSYYGGIILFDTSKMPPGLLSSNPYVSGPMASNGPSARAWDRSGRELLLPSLEPDGVQYPTPGAYYGSVAYSPGHGGVLAFSQNISLAGKPINTHVLGLDITSAAAIDDAGDLFVGAAPDLHQDPDLGPQNLTFDDLHPHVTGMDPATLYVGPQTVRFTGSGLGAALSATLDGASVPLAATAPDGVAVDLAALPAGYHRIRVTTAWGTSAPLLFAVVDRPAPPVVSTVSPPSVSTNGGAVTLTGSHLGGATSVAFGGTAATSFTVKSDTEIDAVAPAHAGGSAPITVTTPGGPNVVPAALAYVAPTPVVTSTFPGGGSPGTSVTISGSGLLFATAVTFDGIAAVVSSNTDTTIVAVAPAHVSGPAAIVVSTAGGSNAEPRPTFTYVSSPPTLQFVSPSSGSTQGGNFVTLKGFSLTGAASVSFGDTGTSFAVVDDSTILAAAPPHPAGSVPVTVRTPLGTTPAAMYARYNYVAPRPPGYTFHPLPPTRVIDTRTNLGLNGKVKATPSEVPLRGVGGVSSTAVAVVLNVTATNASAPSFLTVFPSGGTVPNASNLNFGQGQTIANLVTVGLNPNGVAFSNASGAVDVVADVEGYYDYSDPAADFYNAVSPTRILDTRTTTPPTKIATTPRTVPVAGIGGLPSTGIDAVLVNITATGSSNPSFLTAFPSGTTKPNASNVNFGAGETIANLALVKLGGGGSLDLATAVGTTDVVLDVVGWFGSSFSGAGFVPVAPSRILDSRIGLGVTGKIGYGLTQAAGVGGTPATGVTAVVVNLTVTNATKPSYLTAWPAGTPPPLASNLNFGAGQTIPNLAVVKVGDAGRIALLNADGLTDVVGDVVGYYTA